MNVEGVSSARTQLQPEHVTAQPTSSKPSSTATVSHDRTTLQSGSSSVQSLAATALQSPEIRQDRVASLRASVRGDEYQLDASRLAASISGSGGR
jgi:flagellar biosynthesis anti-sigma factor FlgM